MPVMPYRGFYLDRGYWGRASADFDLAGREASFPILEGHRSLIPNSEDRDLANHDLADHEALLPNSVGHDFVGLDSGAHDLVDHGYRDGW
jgi:hypothetical protein